jgi:hypothetical protein
MQAWSIYNGRHYSGNEHVEQMTKNENENSREIQYELHYFIMFGCGLQITKHKQQLSLTLLIKVMHVLTYTAYTTVILYLSKHKT